MLGNSPYTGMSAYDPDSDLAAVETAISDFAVILAGLDDTVDWAAIYTQATTSAGMPAIADISVDTGITEAEIVADVDAFADQLDDEINTKVLPAFRGGMRDINAVVSSAFPLGQAMIEGFRDRDVAKHSSAIRLEAARINSTVDVEVAKINLNKNYEVGRIDSAMYLEASKQMVQIMYNRISWEDSYMRALAETKRIKIVAKKEEVDAGFKIDSADAKWDIGVFQPSANMLASIAGSSGIAPSEGPSQTQSALGGAMSGAAMGAMVGGVPGAVVGGILGAAASFI